MSDQKHEIADVAHRMKLYDKLAQILTKREPEVRDVSQYFFKPLATPEDNARMQQFLNTPYGLTQNE